MDRHGTDLTAQTWEGYRLSRQQERGLALGRGGFATRTVAGARIDSPIDRALLNQALRDVVETHEVLRTAYRRVLGERSSVLMVIEEPGQVAVAEIATERTGAEGTEKGDHGALAAHVLTEHRDCDTNAPQPLHVALLPHGAQFHTLVISAARMSVDAASVDVFFRDLQQAYAARAAGIPWRPGQVVQYADFAQWQLEQPAPTDRQKARAALRHADLAQMAPLHLPLELNSQDPRCAQLPWPVPAGLARELRALARSRGVALRSVVLTGWLAALWHACGRPERLAVEAALAGRPFEEMERSIGAFESRDALSAAISETTRLDELLSRVELELSALEESNDEMPSAHMAAGWRRIPGFSFIEHQPFAQDARLRICGLWTNAAYESNKVELAAEAWGDDLVLKLRYQALGMAEGGVEALLSCLQATLKALADDASQLVHALPMLDQDAARALMARTHGNDTPGTPALHWHELLEQAARRTPDAPALRCGPRRWSYRQLDLFANRLAHELRARGVTEGTLVGLHLDRSDLAIAAMLAIAKAGAAYVPIDPALPLQRRSLIFAEALLRQVLTSAAGLPDLPAGIDAVVLDAQLSCCTSRSSETPGVRAAAQSPAYVLFTSGSTGLPKGVVVSHGQLAAYIDGVAERLALSGPVSAVALGGLATDLGNTALFLPLTRGGELLVIEPEVSADAQALATELAASEFDLMKITPSHLAAVFAAADAPEKVLPRRCLVLGGEPFSWGWFNLFQSFAGDCRIFNHYGPTETTVGVLCGQVSSSAMADLASTVALGTPLRHARTFILDPLQRPVPFGVAGELWIGGATVSQGYLTHREGEAERFFPDPWSPAANARMYRSGDRARHLPDGSIEFLGRIGRQIKVRGFRVELSEIEAVMRQHPRVSASLAIEAGESSATHIVGYVVDAEGSRGSAEWLRPFLAERLPDFMVPTHIVALDRFPLTMAGKVDAKMLPEPGAFGEAAPAYVEPRTPTEAKVAAIVAELLLLKRVGADDDFFEIGGHSLLATQLVTQLRKAFQIDLKLRSLFEYPVVSELAEWIDSRIAAKAAQS